VRKLFLIVAAAFLFAAPLIAQRRVDLIVDVEGVRRTGHTTMFEPVTRLDPTFSTGGGVGGGFNWFFTDRVSLEAKVAGMESHLRIRTIVSDFVGVADLGYAQIYPITAILQWHMSEHGAVRPYLGVGAAHIILKNINRQSGTIAGVRFTDPTGVVADGGLEVHVSHRWSIFGDARYIPVETSSRARFTGTTNSVELNVRPLIVSTGIAYHF